MRLGVSNGKRVNIGSPERPVWVPEKSLRPETEGGRSWWGRVASGSVVLKPEVLDRLLEATNNQKS